MKVKTKIALFISSILLLLGGAILSPSIAYALPYGNETYGPEGQLVSSQPTYVPERRITIPYKEGVEKLSLTDMCIDKDDGYIYISDNETKRIIALSNDDSTYKVESTYAFKSTMGISVNKTKVYVADQ